jgi:hypothetical protein
MTLYIAAPTSSTALLVLNLLSTGGQHHEKDIEVFAGTNRASHFISILRKDGWEIQTVKGNKGEGSHYMMTNPDQCDRVQDISNRDFDITSALETMKNPPSEVESIYIAKASAPAVLGQLSLFTEDNKRRDKRFSAEELIKACMQMINKTQLELLSGDPTVFESKVQAQIAKASVEMGKAYDMMTKGES